MIMVISVEPAASAEVALIDEPLEAMAAIRAAFRLECDKAGIEHQGFMAPLTESDLRVDPFDQSVNWFGFWRNPLGLLLGSVQVRESGQIFAEYDLTLMRPIREDCFVEAVSVWGTPEALKGELRLMSVTGQPLT